jgi:hypothetical protein
VWAPPARSSRSLTCLPARGMASSVTRSASAGPAGRRESLAGPGSPCPLCRADRTRGRTGSARHVRKGVSHHGRSAIRRRRWRGRWARRARLAFGLSFSGRCRATPEQCLANAVHGWRPAGPARLGAGPRCLAGDVAAIHQHCRRRMGPHPRGCGRVVLLPLSPDGRARRRPQRASEVLSSRGDVGAALDVDQFDGRTRHSSPSYGPVPCGPSWVIAG